MLTFLKVCDHAGYLALAGLLPQKGLSPAGWYAVTATAAFVIVPLAIVALLVYLLYKRV